MKTDQARSSTRKLRRGQRPNRAGNRSSPSTPSPSSRGKEFRYLWQKVIAFFSGGSLRRAPKCTHGSRNGNGVSVRRRQKPEFVAVTSPKLYVGNLSFDATESDLFDLFRGVGKVQNAEVVCHRDTQRSKGFAFVLMGSKEEALRAVEVLHDKNFLGRKLTVSGAKSKNFTGPR